MYAVTISEEGVHGNVQGFLEGVTDLIVMIPPGLRRNTGSDYVLKMTHFLAEIEKAKVSQLHLRKQYFSLWRSAEQCDRKGCSST